MLSLSELHLKIKWFFIKFRNPPQCDPRGAFFIVWKRSFLYDKKTPFDRKLCQRASEFKRGTTFVFRKNWSAAETAPPAVSKSCRGHKEPLSDNGDYRESLPRSCAFSSPIPKPHSVLLCSGLLSAIRDPLCQPGKRTLLLPHLCPCTMYTIGKN